ncbi:hypothetical protein H4Q26_013106 [Puccinia striiformis f. sp. tritici PST-130]|nr:hypothetical protein H4Q26_013106 [Puccinia striiformis f. sp. tritici PST-130]
MAWQPFSPPQVAGIPATDSHQENTLIQTPTTATIPASSSPVTTHPATARILLPQPKNKIRNNYMGTPVDAGVTLVCVSPNGTLLAGDSMGTVVRLWDIHNGLLLEKLKGHLDSVYSVAFPPDRKFLVSGSLNGLWNISALHDHDGYSPSNQTGGATLESKDL